MYLLCNSLSLSLYIYIYIYIYKTPGSRNSLGRCPETDPTVGFHNFNLRIFNSRVSNPNKLIVDVFLTRCRISMCQGLGQKENDEIS